MLKKYFFVAVLCLFYLSSFAQENSSKLWTSVEYKTELNKRWDAEFAQLFRMKDDLDNVDSHITEAAFFYSPKKRWKIGAELRYQYRNDTKGGIQGFENMYRYRFNLEKKFKVPHGNLAFRIGYQNRISLDRDNRKKQRWRLRPSYEWKIKNWQLDPKFYFEYIETLNINNVERAFRYGIGSKFKWGKVATVGFRYIFEHNQEMYEIDQNHHILALKLSFEKPKKKKKEDKDSTSEKDSK